MNAKMQNPNEARLKPLFEASLTGDGRALEQLLKAVSELARKFVARKTGGHSDGEEVVQEILISVHKALPTYDPARKCMPWLAAIMHYRMSDWLRKQYRPGERDAVPLEEVEFFLEGDVTTSPLEYEYITKAVAGLPEKQQAVLHAMYREELTVKEASAKLGMSVSAVKVTAHRAYKRLREELKEA